MTSKAYGDLFNIDIVSFFRAIQGEGRNAGQNVHFIRLFTDQCFPSRRRCIFCDTVNRKNYNASLTPHSLATAIKDHKSTLEHFVITGGEPFAYGSEQLLNFMHDIKYAVYGINWAGRSQNKIKFDFETNGSMFNKQKFKFDEFFPAVINESNIITISPKLANACKFGMSDKEIYDDYDFNTLRDMQRQWPEKFDFKFVVNVDDKIKMGNDLKAVWDFQERASIPSNRLWIMGMTPYNNKDNIKELADIVVNEGVNYSPRLHVDIWGSNIEDEK